MRRTRSAERLDGVNLPPLATSPPSRPERRRPGPRRGMTFAASFPPRGVPRSRRLAAPLAALVVGVFLARAAAAGPLSFDARYAVTYGGLPAAEARLRVEDGAAAHRSVLEFRATGLVGLITRFASRSVAEGVAEGGPPLPADYRAETEKRDSTRSIRVAFDPRSGDVTALDVRKRGRPQESEVPTALRRGVMDPLTAILRLRRAAREGRAAAANVFDGRRRFDLAIRPLGRGVFDLDGRAVPALRLRVDFRPRAGFNDRERAPTDEGGWIEALVSADGRAVPLSFTTKGTVFGASVRLVADGGAARRGGSSPDG